MHEWVWNMGLRAWLCGHVVVCVDGREALAALMLDMPTSRRGRREAPECTLIHPHSLTHSLTHRQQRRCRCARNVTESPRSRQLTTRICMHVLHTHRQRCDNLPWTHAQHNTFSRPHYFCLLAWDAIRMVSVCCHGSCCCFERHYRTITT